MDLTIQSKYALLLLPVDLQGLHTSGINASENNINQNSPYIEETSTTAPLIPENDYLLTKKSLRYTLLLVFRQELDSRKFVININAVDGSSSETVYILTVQNRSLSFQRNSSIFGIVKLASVSSWQKLLVSFNHQEISVTQSCQEFNYLSLPSISKLEEWEKIAVTALLEDAQDSDIKVCILTCCKKYSFNCYSGVKVAWFVVSARDGFLKVHLLMSWQNW